MMDHLQFKFWQIQSTPEHSIIIKIRISDCYLTYERSNLRMLQNHGSTCACCNQCVHTDLWSVVVQILEVNDNKS